MSKGHKITLFGHQNKEYTISLYGRRKTGSFTLKNWQGNDFFYDKPEIGNLWPEIGKDLPGVSFFGLSLPMMHDDKAWSFPWCIVPGLRRFVVFWQTETPGDEAVARPLDGWRGIWFCVRSKDAQKQLERTSLSGNQFHWVKNTRLLSDCKDLRNSEHAKCLARLKVKTLSHFDRNPVHLNREQNCTPSGNSLRFYAECLRQATVSFRSDFFSIVDAKRHWHLIDSWN